ncbi:MAG: branched-chain amino acid ABC transporter permease [Chloroflexota bacterium]|nr:MAG: branched-chain amino acid ABC transporter permease [Chloroflexota bacterium]
MLVSGVRNVSYAQDMAIVRTRLQWVLFVLFFVLLAVLPVILPSRFMVSLILIGISIVALHGLNLVTGYAGQISLGHAAFMAVGAFSSAYFVVQLHWPFWVALPLAGVVAAVVGMIFGVPSLRIKGFYLALATLAAHFVIIFVINRLPQIGGALGQLVPRPAFGGLVINDDVKYYYMVVSVAVIMTFFAKNLVRTNIGRALVAVRDSDLAAEVMGVDVFRYKVLAFGLSAFYAGIAGALLAFYMGMANTQYHQLNDAIWYLGMLVVGGLGTTMGPIFGAIFFQIIQEFVTFLGPAIHSSFPFVVPEVSSGLSLIVWALIVLLFLIFEPRGFSHRWEIFKAYYRLHPYAY